MKPGHRPRDDPYPDELDQLFCDECETLCRPGRPCMCCWVDEMEERQAAWERRHAGILAEARKYVGRPYVWGQR